MTQASLGDSGVLVNAPSTTDNNNSNPNDISASGILVEPPTEGRRRIIKASTPTNTASSNTTQSADEEEEEDDPVTIVSSSTNDDEELLQESYEHSRQKRLQQAAKDQRSKRSTKQAKGRTNPSRNSAQANPFSRFLTAFSVDTKYPHHKRAYNESSDSNDEDEEPPSKHPRTEDYADGDDVAGDDETAEKSPALMVLSDIAETVWDNISLMAVGAAVASLAFMTLIRKKA